MGKMTRTGFPSFLRKSKIRVPVLIFTLLLGTVVLLYFGKKVWQGGVLGTTREEEYLLIRNSPVNPLIVEKTINLGNGKQLAQVYHLFQSLSGLAILDYKDRFLSWLPEGDILPSTPNNPRSRAPGEYLKWFMFDSLDDIYGSSELLVQYGNTGTSGTHPFYLYSYDGEEFKLLLKLVEASSKTEIRDLDNSWPEEIVHEFSISGIGKLERDLLRWKDIWRLEDGEPVKVNHQFPQEYQELIDLHQLALTKKEWEPYAKSYYPTLRCLKEKAELTTQGELIDIGECKELLRKRYE